MHWADLQRIIAEEVAAALARGRTRTCECHSVLYDCCPDRVRASSMPARHAWACTRAKRCRRALRVSSITRCSRPTRRARRSRSSAGRRATSGSRPFASTRPGSRSQRDCCVASSVGVCTVVGLSARRDHDGCEAVRDPPRHLRRRERSGHGDQRRRTQVRRSRGRRARHRGGCWCVQGLRRAEQGHHRSGASDRRGKGDGVLVVESRGGRLRQDVDGFRSGRCDGRRRRA